MTIYDEIAAERVRQHDQWGEQNHPSADPVLVRYGEYKCTGPRLCEEYEIPTEQRAKQRCEDHLKRGDASWPLIAIEELSEAVEAFADGTEDNGRAELVQLAAVIVQWIECIDRRKKP